MVRIRLRRVGAKKQPSYRVVVADARSPRDGRFIEIIGFYNPRTEPPTVQIKEDRALYWLSVGAQPSDPVTRMLKKMGTFDKLIRLKAGEDMETLLAETVAPEEAPVAEQAEEVAAVEATSEPAEEPVEGVEEAAEVEPVGAVVAEAEAPEVAETDEDETEVEAIVEDN